MPRGRKKKEVEQQKVKNCCFWANCEKFCKPDRKNLCCSFCPTTGCNVRCKDDPEKCESRCYPEEIGIDGYNAFKTEVKEEKKVEAPEAPKEEIKRGRGRPPKTNSQPLKSKEEVPQVKRGRGRPPKNK